MIYDQALLAMTYTEAFLVTSRDLYAGTARDILDFTIREMRDPEGGLFFSSQDADTRGEEGGYSIWTTDEIRSCLSREDYATFCRTFAVEDKGNFPEGMDAGKNILFMRQGISPHTATASSHDTGSLAARENLFKVRQKRTPPGLDNKCLTDMNGLMIAALAKAGSGLREQRYIHAAEQAAEFLLRHVRDEKGRLLHVYVSGASAQHALIDDYAFLAWGLLELYTATFKTSYFTEALRLTKESIELFWDQHNGGFFMTANDAETVITRFKDFSDNAIPSGNAAAFGNLIRLARLTGDSSFENKAFLLARACSKQISSMPDA